MDTYANNVGEMSWSALFAKVKKGYRVNVIKFRTLYSFCSEVKFRLSAL